MFYVFFTEHTPEGRLLICGPCDEDRAIQIATQVAVFEGDLSSPEDVEDFWDVLDALGEAEGPDWSLKIFPEEAMGDMSQYEDYFVSPDELSLQYQEEAAKRGMLIEAPDMYDEALSRALPSPN